MNTPQNDAPEEHDYGDVWWLLILLAVVAMFFAALASTTGCAIPNIQQVRTDLKVCADQCNEANDVCFQIAQDGADQCLVTDAAYQAQEQCVSYWQKQGTKCVHTLVSCLSDCIGAQ